MGYKLHSTLPIMKKCVEIFLHYRWLFIKGDVIIGEWRIFGVEVFLHYSWFFIKGDFVIGRVECTVTLYKLGESVWHWMVIVSQILCRPMNFIQSRKDNCIKVANINCHWGIALCDNCNQSILPCGAHVVSIKIKSETWPMKLFFTFTEGYMYKLGAHRIGTHYVWKLG